MEEKYTESNGVSRSRPPRRSAVSGRLFWRVVAAIVLAGVAVILYILISAGTSAEPRLLDHPLDTEAVFSFAGSFPQDPDARLMQPAGLALRDGRLFVTEADAGRLRVFELSGGEVDRISLESSEFGRVYPVDVAVREDGDLLVVDTAGGRVLLVSPRTLRSPLLSSYPLPELASGAGQPTAVLSKDEVTFIAEADRGVWMIDEFEGSTRLLGEGIAPALTFVGGMTLWDGTLLVSDSNAGRVVRLVVETGGLLGVIEERFQLPRGIAVPEDGHLFVADTFTGSISLFDPSGELVERFDAAVLEPSDEAPVLSRPQGAVYDESSQRLFVVDGETGRVFAFNVRLPDGNPGNTAP